MAQRRLIKSPLGAQTVSITPQPSPSRRLWGERQTCHKEAQFPPSSPLRTTLSGRHSDPISLPAKVGLQDELAQIFWRCATIENCTIDSSPKDLLGEKTLRYNKGRVAECPLTNTIILHHYRDLGLKQERKTAKLATRRASKKPSTHFLPAIVIPPLEPIQSPCWRLYRTGRKETGRQTSISPLAV